MRHQKPLAVRIFIRICVVFMALSLILVYVVYMVPSKQVEENVDWVNTWIVENSWLEQTLILPEIDPENPENTSAPIVVSDEEESNEMDQTISVPLENWEVEDVRQGDLWTDITITQ